jgi:hypothetical protein
LPATGFDRANLLKNNTIPPITLFRHIDFSGHGHHQLETTIDHWCGKRKRPEQATRPLKQKSTYLSSTLPQNL